MADEKKVERKKCEVCCQLIPAQQIVLVMDRQICSQHLKCFRCNVPLLFDVFGIDRRLYCEGCYEEARKQIKCKSCKGYIEDVALKELDSYWHKSCFLCHMCHKPFLNNRYCVVNNKPFCVRDAQKLIAEIRTSPPISSRKNIL